jgi:energy-coupling factor transporter transmembrane protein EcfT
MIFFNNYTKIHLFIIFFIYFIFYLIDHNNKVIKHGLFNFIGFLLSTLLLMLIFFITKIIIVFIKKRKYYIIILILITFSYSFYKFKKHKLNHFFCDKWARGFNNTFIDNSSKDYPCYIYIPQPHSCYLSEIGPYFDFTRIYRPTCLDHSLIEYEKKKFMIDINSLKYIKKSNKSHFGYPLTNNKEFEHDFFGTICQPGNKSFENEINKNIILMDLFKKKGNII